MISKIMKDVLNELPSSDFDRLVGVETHVEPMKTMISLESDEVKIVGIWGQAGIGKTTIARALYQEVSCNFQLKFYMENLEGAYNRTTRDPNRLQKHLENEIYSGVLDHRGMKILDLQEVQFRLKHQRVLLILDDVSSMELQALGDLIQGFRFGSKVIVTNENLNTLRDNGIKQIYIVSFPSTEEAQQIFSYSAFGQSSPPRGYLKHVVEVAKLVSPFPLGLKVLGSALRGKSKEEWRMTPAKLKTYLSENDVEKVIRYVYDGLSEKHKYLFCLLRGSKNDVMFSLAGREWDVEEGIQTLANLALISISSEGGILVHHVVEKLMWEMSTL
uniref:NB-ARC domain-containing protein n=1 Tax=Brassica oleracea var. oleracea TaxID=109376 RepID=A0A0D3EEK9_BRAOL